MGYISIRKARLQNELSSVQTQISNLESVLTEMSATGNQSYAFDSGEGSQRTTRRSLKDIQDSIDRLYARESHLINELYGMGIVSVRLRRKSSSGLRNA
jgi:hypothetical protein